MLLVIKLGNFWFTDSDFKNYMYRSEAVVFLQLKPVVYALSNSSGISVKETRGFKISVPTIGKHSEVKSS